MKIDAVSDLHLDFWIKRTNPQDHRFENAIDDFIRKNGLLGGDVLIVAGDLGHYYQQDALFLAKMRERYSVILVVPGNHDMYLVSNNIQKKYDFDSFKRLDAMRKFCESLQIDYLEGQTIEYKGVKFGGCGMSWDKSFLEKLQGPVTDDYAQSLFRSSLNDHRFISEGKTLHSTLKFNQIEFFNQQKSLLANYHEQDIDVIVTHYSPLQPFSGKDKYAHDPVSTFFMFDGREDIDKINPKVWVFGHTHSDYDFEYGDTRFICNPRGYPGERNHYRPKSFEV